MFEKSIGNLIGRIFTRSFIRRAEAIFLVAFLFVVSAHSEAGNQDPMVVRVGYFAFKGYHEMDENGQKKGYGFDIYTLFSRYANIRFEYVGYDKNWTESMEMLKNGEIDMMSNAHYSKDRASQFNYTKPIGNNSIRITCRKDDSRYIPGVYSSYNGMLIGVIENSVCEKKLIEFTAENPFNYKIKNYGTFADLEVALEAHEIDAIASTNLRQSLQEKLLDEFDNEYFYIMVRKDKPELLAALNDAIDQLNQNESDWKNRLYFENYMAENYKVLNFSPEELDFIREHSTPENSIRISTDTSWVPFSWWDGKKYQGILLDIFDSLMGMSGLCYEFCTPLNSVNDASELQDDSVSAYICNVLDSQAAERKGLLASPVLLSPSVSYLYRKDVEEFRNIGLCLSNPVLNKTVELPEGSIVSYFNNSEEAVRDIKRGKIDAVLLYTYDAVRIENGDKVGILNYKLVPGYSIPVSIVTRNDKDHILMSILSKCINRFSETDKDTIVTKYISFSAGELTFWDYVVMNPIVFLVIVIVLLSAFIIGVFYISRKNARIKIEEARTSQMEVYNKKIEEALKDAEHANLSKTIFLNNMSHDIRTPMNAIIGFTTLAESHLDDREKVKDYLGKIATSSGHLLAIINDVLDMSRIESGKVEIIPNNVCLSEIISDIQTIINASVKSKNLNMSVETIDVENDLIVADKLRINQALLNVLSNATKFTPEGGSVKVTVTQLRGAPSGFCDYEFSVRDTGIGMSREFQRHIFEPFTREKTATVSGIQGTGLGMAITKNIIEMMGGTIAVESEEGKGSEFKINLRFAVGKEKITSDVKESASVSLERMKGKKILLVEDNELNQEIASTILRESGFIVDIAGDGTEAVDIMASEKGVTYDVILMDIQMPKLDGYEATIKIRSLESQRNDGRIVPIIAMTANAFYEEKWKVLGCGMQAHVPKPISTEELLRVLSKFL